MASVNLNNLYKTFDGSKYVVNGININIDDGAFLVIVGPSGCGKSTTLNLIAGLESVSKGDIYINENKVTDVEPKDRNIAMVFQGHALYPHLTVWGNLAFSLKVKRINKKLIEEKVRKIANMLGVSDLLKRKPHQLSGGQKQRVALGRAIIREPLVFLMDEPLSNLDANLKTSMREEIKRLHKELKATFVYVTHDQIEAMTLATQLVVMNDGKIQQIGRPYDVFMNPANIFVAKFIGTYPLNVIQCELTVKSDEFYINAFGGVFRGHFESTDIRAKSIILAIRPEGFEPSVDNIGLKLQIISTEVLGVDTLAKCHITDASKNNVNVILPTNLLEDDLKQVVVKLKPSMVMLFNADTGQRIQLQNDIEFELCSYDSSWQILL